MGEHTGRLLFNDRNGLLMLISVVPPERVPGVLSGVRSLLEHHHGVVFVSETFVSRADYFQAAGDPSGSSRGGHPAVSDTGAAPDTTDPDDGEFPLKSFLGMALDGDVRGTATAHVDVAAKHLNPNGVVHGAVLFALVDTAMGKATMSVVDDPGVFCASIELSLRFIRPVSGGRLTATVDVVKRGRSVVHLDARVESDDGKLVATSAGTFALLGD